METITSELPICTGYLDTTLEVFNRHDHPLVLVGTLAVTWSGVNSLPRDEIDLLVRPGELEVIVQDLVALGDWVICENPATLELIRDTSLINTTSIRDVWLTSSIEDPFFHHLRLWPETLYKLRVDCAKIEVPDVLNRGSILLEEEYYRDEHQRFGPPRRSTHPILLLPPLQTRAKLLRTDIPILVPPIQAHLDALLNQARAETDSRQRTGNAPKLHIQNFVRYLYLDWVPNREWILASKISNINRPLMRSTIENFQRKQLILWDPVLEKSVFDKMPWELSIKRQAG
ncbi:MAG: hypothetical protein Q9196_005395 [Gyalolechia fulgens]